MRHGAQLVSDTNSVSPEYLEMMGVKLIAGRLIRETDTADSPKVAVVDQTLANALWPGQNAIGHFFNMDDPAKPVWRQVVGVIAPTRNRSLDAAPRPSCFLPLAQTTGYVNFVVVETHASTAQVAQLLRSAVARVDADQGVFFVQSFSDLVGGTIAVRRFLFIGAPGRAHSLGGESPLHTRQGEVLAERQGCPSRGGIWRKL